jgi:ankyrin repeat protein
VHCAAHHPSTNPAERNAFLPADVVSNGQKGHRHNNLVDMIATALNSAAKTDIRGENGNGIEGKNNKRIKHAHLLQLGLLLCNQDLKDLDLDIISLWRDASKKALAQPQLTNIATSEIQPVIPPTPEPQPQQGPLPQPDQVPVPMQPQGQPQGQPAPQQHNHAAHKLQVKLPPNIRGGDQMKVRTPLGDELLIRIPPHTQPGSMLTITIPAMPASHMHPKVGKEFIIGDPVAIVGLQSAKVLNDKLAVVVSPLQSSRHQIKLSLPPHQVVKIKPENLLPHQPIPPQLAGRYQEIRRSGDFSMLKEFMAELPKVKNVPTNSVQQKPKSTPGNIGEPLLQEYTRRSRRGSSAIANAILQKNEVACNQILNSFKCYSAEVREHGCDPVEKLQPLESEENTQDLLNLDEKVDGRPILALAIGADMDSVAIKLLVLGCNPLARDIKTSRTALYIAIEFGKVEIAKEIYRRNPNLNIDAPLTSEKDKFTAVHVATRYHRVDSLTFLLSGDPSLSSRKADINILEKEFGYTPLMVAAIFNNYELAHLLMKAGANVTPACSYVFYRGRTAAYIAAEHGHWPLLSCMRNYGLNLDGNISEHMKVTLLHVACQYRQTLVVKHLLEAGVDVNACENAGGGYTPLMRCCLENATPCAMILLKHESINVSRPCLSGHTALFMAIQNGLCLVVKEVLKKRMHLLNEPTVTIDEKQQPLHVACRTGHYEMVDFLLSSGADPNGTTQTGNTPLICALTLPIKSIDVVSRLVECEARPNIGNRAGTTPLEMAIKSKNVSVVAALLDPLKAREGGTREVQGLVNSLIMNADPSGTPLRPLHLAVKICNHPIVLYLLQEGADPSLLDSDGSTGQTSLNLAQQILPKFHPIIPTLLRWEID